MVILSSSLPSVSHCVIRRLPASDHLSMNSDSDRVVLMVTDSIAQVTYSALCFYFYTSSASSPLAATSCMLSASAAGVVVGGATSRSASSLACMADDGEDEHDARGLR